ncbi:MAG TPA: Hsp20/alpha crystallin family protein [Thermoanaerobaculia bacterium]|nr:Hsp20/alpha crystallin family protein [Thermoanaerobaculia bacterium]
MYNSTSVNRRNYITPVTAFEAFNRAFAPLFGGDTTPEENEAVTRSWAPRVDVLENTEAYQVTAELPGIKKEEVEITLENNVLTLKGERKFEKDVNQESYHRIERVYGPFARSFTLPTKVAQDRVEAKFDSGLLTITIPKVAEARPKKIEIA